MAKQGTNQQAGASELLARYQEVAVMGAGLIGIHGRRFFLQTDCGAGMRSASRPGKGGTRGRSERCAGVAPTGIFDGRH